MKNNITLCITFVLLLISGRSFAQYHQQITPQLLEQLDKTHQQCLDKGGNMWNCSNIFYNQMDSLLNVVYKSIKNKTTAEAFNNLKKEQIKWIGKRDKVYSDANKESKEEGLGVTDASMVALDREADFAKDRILFLMKTYL